jgi:membrane dipeptidase
MQCKIIAVILAITMILSLGLGCCVEKKEVSESMPPIRKSIPVVDLHCDSLLEIVDKGRNLSRRSDRGHLDVPRMQEGEVEVQCFAAWISPIYYPDRSFGRAKKITDAFEKFVKENKGVEQAFNSKDIERINSQGKIAAILVIEGGSALEGKLSNLDYFYDLGVRYITLTWSYSNQIADGVYERFPKSRKSNQGLTEFGKEVIKEMNELGMLIDVSHMSETSFWQVVNCSRQPVIASHSSVWELCNHKRNLKDGQIKAIAEKGGVIGINFCPSFLNESGKATLEDVVEHINYVVDLVGIDYVAIGSDFDGIDSTPAGLEDVACFPALTQSLLEEGYSRNEVEKIMGENFLRVFKEVCG